jgi:putative FmdB family regulatory protein
MPIYEYKCNECGRIFEAMQRFSDEPLTTHEGCGGAVERLLSAPALQFKGSGWYITDYAKANGKGSKKNGSPSNGTESKSDSTKSDSTKSDSKPASTPTSS